MKSGSSTEICAALTSKTVQSDGGGDGDIRGFIDDVL
jgi:hypothetical protein